MTSTAYQSVITEEEAGHSINGADTINRFGYTGLRGLISKPEEAFVKGRMFFFWVGYTVRRRKPKGRQRSRNSIRKLMEPSNWSI